MHAYFGGQQIWAEIHISKVLFGPKDQQLFQDIVDGAKVIDDYQPGSQDFFKFGSFFYAQKQYKKAASLYESALELQEQDGQLGSPYWEVAVDNLGMAYGISGDLKKAKEVFQYGLTKRPDYPLFHYNLACAYAEMNDLDSAIAALRKAFEYRRNVLPGESMPDPDKDESFTRWRNDPKFQQVLKSLPRS